MFHMDFNREKREVYDPNGLNFVQGPSLISVCPRTYVSDVVDPHEYDTNNSCIPVMHSRRVYQIMMQYAFNHFCLSLHICWTQQ